MPVSYDEAGGASVTCDCGKEITKVTDIGMFCEDFCGYEESQTIAAAMEIYIERMEEVL